MKTETILIIILIYFLFFRKAAAALPAGDWAAMKRQQDINAADLATLNDRVYALEKTLNTNDFA